MYCFVLLCTVMYCYVLFVLLCLVMHWYVLFFSVTGSAVRKFAQAWKRGWTCWDIFSVVRRIPQSGWKDLSPSLRSSTRTRCQHQARTNTVNTVNCSTCGAVNTSQYRDAVYNEFYCQVDLIIFNELFNVHGELQVNTTNSQETVKSFTPFSGCRIAEEHERTVSPRQGETADRWQLTADSCHMAAFRCELEPLRCRLSAVC